MDLENHLISIGFAAVFAICAGIIKTLISLKQWQAGHEAASSERKLSEDSAIVSLKSALTQATENGQRLERISTKLDKLTQDLDAVKQNCFAHLARVAGNHEGNK